MILDKIQQEIVESDASKILVVAGSGSGKTRVLTERIKYLIEKGEEPSKIVAITFTNAAAEEIKERLGDIAKGAYIGTIHGYANNLLIHSNIDTKKFISDADFDVLFDLINKNLGVIQPVKHLLVDEFQDVDDKQYDFLFLKVIPKNFFIVGDDWQNIYSFRGANVKYFLNFAKNKNVKVFFMENNYRTGKNIINFAEAFLKKVDNKIDKKTVCKTSYSGKITTIPSMNLDFISNEILKNKDYKDWFVITRSNRQISDTISTFGRNNIPCDTFKKSDLDKKELKSRLESNTVKVLTAHSAKGLENKNVAVIGLSPRGDDERRLCYVACTRAKERLIWCYNYNQKRDSNILNNYKKNIYGWY